MIFSDKDLEKFKGYWYEPPGYYVDIKREVLQALLARLRAAEKVCEIANSKDAYTTAKWVQRFSPALEAWLASKGEDSSTPHSERDSRGGGE